MPLNNQKIFLNSYPKGMPSINNFSQKEVQMEEPQEDEVLVKTIYLSVDSYMRGRMTGRTSYTPPFQIGEPLTGGVVGKVVASKSPNFKEGDYVLGFLEWANYSIAKGSELKKIDPSKAPVSTALGVLGMPGMTAYFGLLDIGKPKSGETVMISGAAGAVGMLVGQIAKIKGCRVIGIAGSEEKLEFLTKDLHFDAAINYKNPNFKEALKNSCPNGVDIYFDNVGGEVTDNVITLLNWHARIVICGQISMYNLEKADVGPRPYMSILVKSALVKGFIVTLDYQDRFSEGIQKMAEWLMQGKLQYRETVVNGLENAPAAFLGLFTGKNTGKQIVKVAKE